MSQRDLADLTSIAKGHISDLENGKRPFNARHVELFSEVFGVDPADLLESAEDREDVREWADLFLELGPEDRRTALLMTRALRDRPSLK